MSSIIFNDFDCVVSFGWYCIIVSFFIVGFYRFITGLSIVGWFKMAILFVRQAVVLLVDNLNQ